MIDRWLGRLMDALLALLAVAFVGAVALNFANVVGRYGFGRSISFADETQVYVMVFMAFLGAAIVAWRRTHLRMDVLARMLPAGPQHALRVAEQLLLVVLGAFVCVQSSRYTLTMFELGRRSDNAGIPMWIPHGAVAIGFGLIAVVSLRRLFDLRSGEREVTPPAAGEGASP